MPKIGQRVLIGIDNVAKFIPIISTVGSMADLFQKHITMRKLDVEKTDNIYARHIKNQSSWISIILLVPVLGNFGYVVYKIIVFVKKKEPKVEESTTENKNIEETTSEKPTKILTPEKKGPTNPIFKSFIEKEVLDEGMKLINCMKRYIKSAVIPESEKDKVNAIKEVLKTMKSVCQMAAEVDPGLKVTAIYCDDGELSGIMCTNYDFSTERFTLNDMVTAPWNVGPPLEINIGEKAYTPAPRYGIGSLLLNKAIEMAKENNCKVIGLMSLNEESTKFYVKNGFKAVGTGYPLAMEKEIN